LTVAQKAPNGWGFHDLSGNLYEWVWDWESASYYASSPSVDPTGPVAGSYPVLRGGYWDGFDTELRVSRRWAQTRAHSASYAGVRLARTIP
jgi:formylglycine-generating enzyme required for sulfatase activity